MNDFSAQLCEYCIKHLIKKTADPRENEMGSIGVCHNATGKCTRKGARVTMIDNWWRWPYQPVA